MEEKRFHREDYPLDILAEFGLTEEMIYDLPEFVHETLERGGKSLESNIQLVFNNAAVGTEIAKEYFK